MRGESDLFSFVGHTGRKVHNKIQVYLRGENCPADTTLIVKKSSCYLKPQKKREYTRTK